MKKIWLSSLCLATAIFSFLSSCKDDEESDQDYGFVTYAGFGMRFVDGNGNDLVDMNNMSTYPIIRPSIISSDSVKTIMANMDSVWYYGSSDLLYDGNRMEIDKRDSGTYISPYIYGDHSGVTNNYIYVNGDIDTIQVHWTYPTDCIGSSYCAEITNLTYNGVVIKTQEWFEKTIVTITKDNGKTSVKVSH